MSENKMLNLRNFVKDTNNFDVNSEIAVMISGIPLALPIRSVTHSTFKGSDRKFVLLHIDWQDVMTAWNYVKDEENKNATKQ